MRSADLRIENGHSGLVVIMRVLDIKDDRANLASACSRSASYLISPKGLHESKLLQHQTAHAEVPTSEKSREKAQGDLLAYYR